MTNESLFTLGLPSLTTKLTHMLYRLGFWKLIDLNREMMRFSLKLFLN